MCARRWVVLVSRYGFKGIFNGWSNNFARHGLGEQIDTDDNANNNLNLDELVPWEYVKQFA